MRRILAAILCFVLLTPALLGEERVDLDMVTRIRQEGFRNSKVMDTASNLMDKIGARLTGSPNMKRANDWTRKQLEEWGLANAHLESWEPFGRGWSYEVATVRMLSPDVAELLALPLAWSPGTDGPLRAQAEQKDCGDGFSQNALSSRATYHAARRIRKRSLAPACAASFIHSIVRGLIRRGRSPRGCYGTWKSKQA